MTFEKILMQVPPELAERVANKTAERLGAIIVDKGSRKILGHVQEAALEQVAKSVVRNGAPAILSSFGQQLLGAATSPGFSNISGAISVVQNEQIKRRLKIVESMLGSMQSMQVASLVSSVAGIGVTAASTAIIWQRLNTIDTTLESIEQKVDQLPAKWREMETHKTLVSVRTVLQRLDDATTRQSWEPVVQSAEEKLHEAVNRLFDDVSAIMIERKIDGAMLRSLIAALALCGGAQIKALFWLNELETASVRARHQYRQLEELSILMPVDELSARISGGIDEAELLAQQCSEIRARVASQPILAEQLIRMGVHGRAYIEELEQEPEEPLLYLPTKSTG